MRDGLPPDNCSANPLRRDRPSPPEEQSRRQILAAGRALDCRNLRWQRRGHPPSPCPPRSGVDHGGGDAAYRAGVRPARTLVCRPNVGCDPWSTGILRAKPLMGKNRGGSNANTWTATDAAPPSGRATTANGLSGRLSRLHIECPYVTNRGAVFCPQCINPRPR